LADDAARDNSAPVDAPAPAAAAPARGIVASVKPAVGDLLPDERQERFAQSVAGGSSYCAAYRDAGYSHHDGNASRLAAVPLVAARIRQLRTAAAEGRVQSIAARMDLLELIAHADPSELTRVVTDPCGECWDDHALAEAMGRALADPTLEQPNVDKPRHDCERCRGRGVQRVVLTPTDELSAAGRALFVSAKQDKDGCITIQTRDQQAAIAELNRMQDGSLAASRSLNANVHMGFIRPATEFDPARLEELFASFGKSGDRP